MATNSIRLVSDFPRLAGRAPLSVSIARFAFAGLLVFSFVPLPIFINVSQIFLLLLCAITIAGYLVRLDVDIAIAFVLILLIAISQTIGLAHFSSQNENYLTSFLFITSLLIAPAMMIVARSGAFPGRDHIVPRIVNWILVFLVIECLSRFIFSPYMKVNPGTDVSDTFYRYKYSLFFFDSNFVGIEILCLLAIMFAYRAEISRSKWLLTYILLLATLSRASIAAGICQLLIYKLWRWRAKTFLALMAAQALIIVKLLDNYVSNGPQAMQAVDGSLSSKFLILSMMTNSYQQADTMQKIFGVGVDNTVNLIGLFAHNIVATFVLELGICGSLLLIAYVWILSRKCPASIYLLVLPMVINGFSLVSTSMPYFFVALGLLGALRGSAQDGSAVPNKKSLSANI